MGSIVVGSSIKSIQNVAATDNTAGTIVDITIAYVNTAKSMIILSGVSSAATSIADVNYTAEFISATVVRLTRAGVATTFRTFRVQVVEFN